MKIALVHDFLLQYGGAERFLETLHALFPEAPVYTLCYDSAEFPSSWSSWEVRTLFPRLPFIDLYPQLYAPLLVSTIQSVDFSEYDVVISSDSIFAKMILCPSRTRHICYQFTPADMLYHYLSDAPQSLGKFLFTGFQKAFLRDCDFVAAGRVDRLLTLSDYTAQRILKYYHRSAEVLYYGVSIPTEDEVNACIREGVSDDYYLVVSRLTPQKRVDLAVAACTRLKKKLIVCGVGREAARLRSIAGETVLFKEFVSDEERNSLYAQCRALLFTSEEDFGLTPLECNAWGRPVIAYRRGGVCETILEGVSGVFFDEQSVSSVCDTITRFEQMSFVSDHCRASACRFSLEQFISGFRAIIDEEIGRVVV
jgi:glycosyltransferase involved in cell wall biosynthesis